MSSPTDTMNLLNQLVELGFTDEYFDIVHHFRGETINKHMKYCEMHNSSFEAGGTNEQVQKRLAIVLNAYVAGGFSNTDVFRYLAHASATEIPYKDD